jgi:Kef-type K+ transport system membrane component KefB
MTIAQVVSLISFHVGISIVLAEIFPGVVGRNFLQIQTAPWIDFMASFGSIPLTFMPDPEITPASFCKHPGPSLTIGTIFFALPLPSAFGFTLFPM